MACRPFFHCVKLQDVKWLIPTIICQFTKTVGPGLMTVLPFVTMMMVELRPLKTAAVFFSFFKSKRPSGIIHLCCAISGKQPPECCCLMRTNASLWGSLAGSSSPHKHPSFPKSVYSHFSQLLALPVFQVFFFYIYIYIYFNWRVCSAETSKVGFPFDRVSNCLSVVVLRVKTRARFANLKRWVENRF